MAGSSLRARRVAWLLAALAAPAWAQADLVPIVGATGENPPPPWVYAGLPAQKPPATRYAIETTSGVRALRIEADRSYGNLLHPLPGTAAGLLTWRWKVDKPLSGANLKTKAGDDAALKVCALFDMPRERVPFIERQVLMLAESRLGESLPSATVCYVWDPTLPPDTLVPNAHSRRLRFITVGGALGAWADQRRDLAQDFLRAFGEESANVPPLRGIAVGADADNTGSSSLAWISELQHRRKAAP